MEIRILAVGDVCGEPGMSFLSNRLKEYISDMQISFTVVNGENANVVGITPKQADLILRAGADVITLGNHTWTRTELRPYLAPGITARSAPAEASRSITSLSGTCAS